MSTDLLRVAFAALAMLGSTLTFAAEPPPDSEPIRVSIPPERIEALRTRLATVCDELHLPGLAIAVVVADEVAIDQGCGWRNREEKLAVDADTRFMIGSTTKAFTSAWIATLVDAGVAHWDDRVALLLPGFTMSDVTAAEDCTLRDLLSHRSGLMRTDMTWYSGAAELADLQRAFGRAEPTAKFRALWQYNNVGYLLAGIAAATREARAETPAPAATTPTTATTATWGDSLQRRLLTPLGMSRTTMRHAQALADPDVAIGYEPVPADDPSASVAKDAPRALRRARSRDLANIAPAGALWSTSRDMGQWLRFQLGRGKLGDRRLVSQERMAEMWQPQIAIGPRPEVSQAADAGAQYGLGWMVTRRRGTRLIAHDGGIDGFTTTVAMLPELGLGFAAMTNVSGASIGAALPGIVFGTLLGENADAAAPAEDFAPFLGTYRADMLRSEFTVLVKDGKLAVDVPGQTVYELRPPDKDGKRQFAIAEDIAVGFERDDAGKVNRMRLYQMGLEFELPRLGATFAPEIADADLADLAGVFHDVRLGKNVTIQRSPEGRLAMDVPGQMSFELRRHETEKDRWDFRLLPRTWIVFTRNDAGRVVGLAAFQNGTRTELPRVGEVAGDEARQELGAEALAELLARHDAAHGFAALRGAGDVRTRGTMNFVNQGVVGQVTTLLRGTERLAQRIEFPPFGWIRSAMRVEAGDPSKRSAEIDTAFDGWHAMSPKELELAMLVSAMPLATADRSTLKSVELVGFDGAGDVRVAKLKLVAPGGAQTTLFVDEKTGLAKRLDGSAQVPGVGAVPIAVAFEDYRDVGGAKLPFRVVADVPTIGRMIQTIESAEARVAVPEADWTIAKP